MKGDQKMGYKCLSLINVILEMSEKYEYNRI